jgi:hypothetical protein
LATGDDRAFQIRWEEYKVIQDKIDRIGDFRFRLRSWLITLLGAGAGAARFAKVPPEVFVLGVPVIVAFYWLEAIQLRWERALGNRAAGLERELSTGYGAPDIVRTLRLAHEIARNRRVVGRFLVADKLAFYGAMFLILAAGFLLSVGVFARLFHASGYPESGVPNS